MLKKTLINIIILKHLNTLAENEIYPVKNPIDKGHNLDNKEGNILL